MVVSETMGMLSAKMLYLELQPFCTKSSSSTNEVFIVQ